MPAIIARLKLDDELIASGGITVTLQLRSACLDVVCVNVASVTEAHEVPRAKAVGAIQHLHVGDGDPNALPRRRSDDPPADDVFREVAGVVGRSDGALRGDVEVSTVDVAVVVAVERLAVGAGCVGRADARAALVDEASVIAGGLAGAAVGAVVHGVGYLLVAV